VRLDQIKKLANLPGNPEDYTREQVQSIFRELGIDRGNLYQELEMSSRYVNTHRDVSQPSDRVQLHSHSFYEILFIRSSGGVQYLVGTERYLLQRGDVVIVRPGVAHRPLLTASLPEPYKRDVLWLSQEFVEGAAKLFPDGFTGRGRHTLLRTAGTVWEDLLRERIRAGVREEEEKARGWEAMVLGNTIQLMSLLRRALEDRGNGPVYVEKPALLEQVLAYVERHLTDKLTLPQVARRFYVSESKISQTFRAQMGVSFHRCVIQRRLIAAKNLIAEGVGLEQLCERVGFSDYSTFYRAFKQEYGVSPRQYKKLQQSSGE